MTVLHKKRCLIFGAGGYIGSHLVHFLLSHHPTNITGFGTSQRSFPDKVDYRLVDVTNSADMLRIDWNVDVVFMFSGLTGTHASFDLAGKFFQVNELGLINILEAIRKSAFRPRVVFPSTRLVYKGSDTALNEDAPCMPKTVYAINKLACEKLLTAYSNSFEIEYTIYRICVPYGSIVGNSYSYGTIGSFLQSANHNRLIRLYGDGLLRRSFVHVEDLCDQILQTCLSDKSRNQTYNTLGEEMNLRSVAEAIANKFDARLEFIDFPIRDQKIESGHTVFDASKLLKHFDVGLKYSLIGWLDDMDLEPLNSQ